MPQEIINSFHLQIAMRSAVEKAIEYRSVFMTPEHLVSAILTLNPIKEAMREFDLNVEPMVGILDRYLMSQDHRVDDDKEYGIDPSAQFESLIMGAIGIMRSSQAPELEVTHVLRAAMNLENSLAGNLIAHYVNSESGLMSEIISKVEEYAQKFPVKGKDVAVNKGLIPTKYMGKYYFMRSDPESDLPPSEERHVEKDIIDDDFIDDDWSDMDMFGDPMAPQSDNAQLSSFVTCINDHVKEHNPLIGRDAELERTIHVLCRKDKNNPLHVGEPGVGKTALVYGLAQRIEEGSVPSVLEGFKIYQIDMAGMIAGTQYRGDFEKRFKNTMDRLLKLEKVIVYSLMHMP